MTASRARLRRLVPSSCLTLLASVTACQSPRAPEAPAVTVPVVPVAPVAPRPTSEEPPSPAPAFAPVEVSGEPVEDAVAVGGLGLQGAGGSGAVGIGSLGGGTGQGFGAGHRPSASSATVRQGPTTVTGRLPPEVVQRIVRAHFGRFRLCYENGLRTQPKLQGQVATKFVIDASGSVRSVSDAGSTLPDAGVVGCVGRSVAGLSFPQPEQGEVTVIYRVVFSPSR